MPARNQPTQQRRDAPAYLNDTPAGFWTENLKAGDSAWASVLPRNIAIEADKQELSRSLNAAIRWMSVRVRWNDIEFPASMNDGQMTMMLEPGGIAIQGSISLVASKAQFRGEYPEQQDGLEIIVDGEWKKFRVTNLSGGFDSSDDSLTLTCEPEDAE